MLLELLCISKVNIYLPLLKHLLKKYYFVIKRCKYREMSNFKKVIVLLLFAIFSMETNAQVSCIHSDSVLYYKLSLDADIAPSMRYDIINKWLCYLKNQLDYGHPYYHRMKDDFYDKLGKTRHDLEYETASIFGIYSSRLDDQSDCSDYAEALYCYFRKWHNEKAPDEGNERKQLIERLEVFFHDATYLPLIYNTIQKKYHGKISQYVERLYSASLMNSQKKLRSHLMQPSVRKILRDPGWQYSESLYKYEYWLKNHDKINRKEWKKYVFRK